MVNLMKVIKKTSSQVATIQFGSKKGNNKKNDAMANKVDKLISLIENMEKVVFGKGKHLKVAPDKFSNV